MCLDAVRALQIPEFDQRVLRGGEQVFLFKFFIARAHVDSLVCVRAFRSRNGCAHKYQAGDLILVSAKSVLGRLGKQVPYDDVRVSRSTSKSRSFGVELEVHDGRAMSIEADNNLSRKSIPDPDRAVRVANGNQIRLCGALRNAGDGAAVVCVVPSRKLLALLHVPADDIFVRADVCFSGACRACTGGFGRGFRCPNAVGRGCADRAEADGRLVFSVIVSCCWTDVMVC
jgi:hypothetical protein